MTTILILPSEGDPHGLLSDHTFGSVVVKAPVVARNEQEYAPGRWCSSGWCPDFSPESVGLPSRAHERALVLAWGGKIIPEGCDRVQRARMAAGATTQQRVQYVLTLAGALAIAELAEDDLGCRIAESGGDDLR